MTVFVVALSAEARPLIEHYGLEPMEGAFRSYRGGGKRLIIAGVGKVAAAGATAFAREHPLDVWLNVGIAGHRDRELGALVRAHTVIDGASGARFYPTLLGLSDLESSAVVTVDAPETEFREDAVYDMEASAFYATALRFSTSELVQCLKVVSDNRATGTGELTKRGIHELVSTHLEDIDRVVTHLKSLADELAPPPAEDELAALYERFRFTVSQRRQLNRLAGRLRAFGIDPLDTSLSPSARASDVLGELEARLRRAARDQKAF